MRRLAINSGDAFILVYSVDDPQSFDDLETLRQNILDEREQAYLEASGCSNIGSMDSSSSTSGLVSANSSQSSMLVGSSGNGGVGQNLKQNATKLSHQLPLPTQNEQAQRQIGNKSGSSSPRHWSLASIFNTSHHQNQLSNSTHSHQGHSSLHQPNICCNSTNQSFGSSISSSACSSADNSRRSSVSAAEAALKTRRTRHPPIVIVANKYDLPSEQHLINSDEIEALAVIDWNNGFVRASAAFDWNINEIFQQVLKQARQPPTLAEAIVSKRRKSLPPKLPHSMMVNTQSVIKQVENINCRK